MLADEGEPCAEARGVKVRGDSIPARSLQVGDVELSFERKLTSETPCIHLQCRELQLRIHLTPGIGL